MSKDQFQIAVSVLFVTYVLSEVPSNLILKHYVSPSRWISSITVAWGLIATLMGLCHNYPSLIACRLLLGLVEGGLFPGCAIYLTFFYTKRELALRIGYLFVSSALAGAFGGLLAYGIGHMEGVAGLSGWRWIFILEGIPTVVLGIFCWFFLADDPDTAYYLTAEEREMVLVRRARQTGVSETFEWKDVRKALTDWRCYMFYVGLFCVDTMLYGYSTFLPTIIRGIMPDASSAMVQILTIPCYGLGAISYMSAARYSDWRQSRGPVVVLFGLISVIGYAMLVSDSPPGVHYGGCFLVAMGLYVLVGIPIAWLPTNSPRYGKRTTATAMQLTFGNCAGIMAPFVSTLLPLSLRTPALLTLLQLYSTNEAPRYVRGHAVTMSMVAAGCILYAALYFYYTAENKKRAVGKRDHLVESKSEEEIVAMGDESPRFMFAR
jgi:MFS family permease